MISWLLLTAAQAGRLLFVSPTGDDHASGLKGHPFRTIQHAANLALAGDTVIVLPGTYRETVVPKRSGSPGRPITYRAAQPGQVILNGCDPITDSKEVSRGLWAATLQSLFDADQQSDQLFVDSKPLDLARWPRNMGTLTHPTDARVVTATDAGGDRIRLLPSPKWDGEDGTWDGAKIWLNLSRLGSNWGQDGQAQTGTVVSTDRATGTITVTGIDKRSWTDGKYNPDQPWGVGPGTEFFLFNPAPRPDPAKFLNDGEWWWNASSKTVFIRPIKSKPNLIESRWRSYAFDLTNCHDLVIDGFRLHAATITTDRDCATRSNSVAEATRITIRNIQGRYLTHFTEHTGQFQMQWLQKSGIRLSGTELTLEKCTLEDVAGAAICVIGQRNRVLGNTIRRANYSVSEAGCIETGRAYDGAAISVDHEIGYNTIEDSPQQGINCRALVNSDPTHLGVARIHHNLIRNVMTRAYDSGAIDQYGTNGRGVRIDHNVILNMVGSLRIGIYLDFGKGYIVDHNAIWNVDRPIQCNWTDAKAPNNLQLSYNTALSAGPTPLPGILNGVGDANPGSRAEFNLASVRVSLGKDVLGSSNATVVDSQFIQPSAGDFRPKSPIPGGAVPYGQPMFAYGASGYSPMPRSTKPR
jgi:Protein of unknown function (DUF1565)